MILRIDKKYIVHFVTAMNEYLPLKLKFIFLSFVYKTKWKTVSKELQSFWIKDFCTFHYFTAFVLYVAFTIWWAKKWKKQIFGLNKQLIWFVGLNWILKQILLDNFFEVLKTKKSWLSFCEKYSISINHFHFSCMIRY